MRSKSVTVSFRCGQKDSLRPAGRLCLRMDATLRKPRVWLERSRRNQALTHLLISGKVESAMRAKETVSRVSALGADARQAASRRRASDPKYAELEKKHEVALAIADLVILHRTRTKLTQEALAFRMRTSVSAISRLESGFHVPSIDTLRKLAAALGGRIKIDIVDIQSPKARRFRSEPA
jgi:ribosome-binding protein aMBF1 (putative translation factor)